MNNSNNVKRLIVRMTIVASLSILAGCAIGANTDKSELYTSAISIADSTPSIAVDPFAQTTPLNQDPSTTDRLLDEDTIRLAVTAADLSKVSAQGLDWANQATGSSGVITNIQQRAEAGQTCRSFKATRNAYDGIILYEGDICLDKGSGWWTRFMRPHSEDAA